MPRVTDAHRQARRDQIADAALRVLKVQGVSDTTMAEIARECGLSIGAIYANFESKADIARYLADRLFAWRIVELEAIAGTEGVHTPQELMRPLLASLFEENRPPLPVVLQFWSEALVDTDLHAVLAGQVERLRASLAAALLPWAAQRTGGDAATLARDVAQACLIMGQGFLANRTLFNWMTAEQFLDALAAAWSPDDPQDDH